MLKNINKASKNSHSLAKIVVLGRVFHLLEEFITEKNSFAPVLYKMLTFSMVENHEDRLLQEFLMMNFIETFRRVSSIPVGILMVPWLKQLRLLSRTNLSLFEHQLLCVIAGHPRLSINHSVLLIDALGQYYMQSPN